MLPERHDAVVQDLKRIFDVVVVRRKDARDTSERWFSVSSIESSDIGGSSVQQWHDSPLLSKSERSNFFLSPCPLRISQNEL